MHDPFILLIVSISDGMICKSNECMGCHSQHHALSSRQEAIVIAARPE